LVAITLNVAKVMEELKKMSVSELREKYCEVFGEQTRSFHKEYLLKRIAWRIQALEEGGLTERALQRAEELANLADLRTTPPRKTMSAISSAETKQPSREATGSHPRDKRLPMPGAVITREYRGQTHYVTILEKGFEYEGKAYRSLTAVAKAITGSHWNGFHFFRQVLRGR
jgi:hypothetical protein